MTFKELRKNRGLSQEDIAEKTGMHKMQISKIERGITLPGNVTLLNALKLCDVLNVSPVVFLNLDKPTSKTGT